MSEQHTTLTDSELSRLWTKAFSTPVALTDDDLRALATIVDTETVDAFRQKRDVTLAGFAKRFPELNTLADSCVKVFGDLVRPLRAQLSRAEADIAELQTKADALTTRLAALESK